MTAQPDPQELAQLIRETWKASYRPMEYTNVEKTALWTKLLKAADQLERQTPTGRTS